MKKHRDPRINKERNYESYHFSPGKYDKAFRKQWPRKKAQGHRLERRKVHTILDCADHSFDSGENAEVEISNVKPQKPVKWTTMTLKERIQLKKEKRELMYRAKITRKINGNVIIK